MARLHIFNRDGVFYWRRRLPAQMVAAFGRSQLRLSLQTRNPREARRIAFLASYRFEQLLSHMHLQQRTPTKEEQEDILRELYSVILDECALEQLRLYPTDELPTGAVIHESSGPDDLDPVPQVDRDRQSFYARPKLSAERMGTYQKENRFSPIRKLLTPLLERRAMDVSADDLPFRQFLQRSLRLAEQAFNDFAAGKVDAQIDRGNDELIDSLSLDQVRQVDLNNTSEGSISNLKEPPPPQAPKTSGRTLASFVDAFLKEEAPHIRVSTLRQKANSLRILVKLVGNMEPNQFSRDWAKKLRDTLQRLPSSYGKSEYDRERSFEECMEPFAGKETMSERTLNRQMRHIRSFLKDVRREQSIKELDVDMFFEELRWDPHVEGEQETLPWTDDRLEKLLKSPIWTGFRPNPRKRYWRHVTGDAVVTDDYWWLPLLALYQGARLEELCQLRGSDVRVDGGSGVLFMDFHEGMQLKNEGAIRQAPIHSAILDLGFAEFAERAGRGLLFQKQVRGGPDEKLGHFYSEKFTDYRKRIDVYEKRMHFHSFRHNFTTAAINNGVAILKVDELTGHDSRERKDLKSSQSESMTYWHGSKMKQLKEAIECVHYTVIDLEELKRNSVDADQQEVHLEKRYPKIWGNTGSKGQ